MSRHSQKHTSSPAGKPYLQLLRVDTPEDRARLREVAEACAKVLPPEEPCFSAPLVVGLLDIIDRKAA